MSDTWNDAKQEYENENSSSTLITNVSNDDLLTPPIINDANSLIKLINDATNVNNLYVIQANQNGEIRFLTKDAKNNNNEELLYNVKIGADGKLYYFHNYTILNPAKFQGWYELDGNITEIDQAIILLNIATGTNTAGVIANGQAIIDTNATLALEMEKIVVLEANQVINETRLTALEDVAISDATDLEEYIQPDAEELADALNNRTLTNYQAQHFTDVLQNQKSLYSSKYGELYRNFIYKGLEAIGAIGLIIGIITGIKKIIDDKKKTSYEEELIRLNDSLANRPISTTQNKLIHTGISIVSGNSGFATPNGKYRVLIQKLATLIINIDATPVASVELVETYGDTPFTIGETISIPKSSLGGGTGGNLVLSVVSLGTLKTWTELKSSYLLQKIEGIEVKNRRRNNIIGADDIDTTQFTTTNVSYTDTTDFDIVETITYKQLKSRLNLQPIGASDVDVYTSTGKIGVGTTPETQIHTYNATNNILRLETATNGEASLEFKRGIDTDVYTDWRLRSATGRFELQYENDVLGYGNTGTTIFSTNTSLLTISKETQIDANVGIGTAPITTLNTYHATNNILRIASGATTGKSSIEFVRGTATDTSADYRFMSESGLFKLQYQDNTALFGATGTDLMMARATGMVIYKNTTFSTNVGIGGVNPHSTYKVNVGGDVNISTGSVYRINGVQLSYNDLTNKLQAGTNITIDANNNISAQVPTANNILSEITSGTLAVAYGGTGANSIIANAILFGNTAETAYTYTTNFKYDVVNGRLAVGLATPAYTIDSGGDINIPTGSVYRINGVQLSYKDLIDKLTAGTNINITSGVISAIVPAQLTAGTNITITSGAINAIVPAQLTAGTNITITSGAINAVIPTTFNASAITAGTLPVVRGGTGASSIIVGGITFGNSTADAYATNSTFIYDVANGRLGVGKAIPAYTIDTNGDINIPTGGTYRINGTALSYNDLTNKLSAGTNIAISAGNVISANVPTTFNASAITAGTLPVSRGGTGLGVVSAGAIPYGNSTSDAYTWRVLFKWDDTNFRLGVNKATPLYTIDSGGDINIPTGGTYRINGTALAMSDIAGTLTIAKGGTGLASIGNGAIPLGNATQDAYTWTNLFKFDITNFRLGVNKATPLYTLDVAGDTNITGTYRVAGNALSFGNIAGIASVSQGGTGLTNVPIGNILFGNGTSAIANATSLKFETGRLGVGISGAPVALLHLGLSGVSTAGVFYVWFDYSSGSSLGFANTTRFDVCAYFQGSVWLAGGRFLASSSDTRIKKEIEDINDDSALNMILAVEPKTYKYIDEVALGNKRVYGFIAQQIREVIPEAINLQKERIPNILLLGTYNNSIITLPSQPTKIVIKVGDTIKCYDRQNKEIIAFVEEVIDTLTFRIKELEEPYTDTHIFIYGTEVDDFHTIDKNYIYTLNVCATQELHRKIVSQEERIRELEEKVERLLNNLT